MSHANAQNNSLPPSSNLHSRPLPLVPAGPAAEDAHYSDNVHYTGLFRPSSFELLYLVNTGEHNDALQRAAVASPVLQITLDGLIHLREQHAALNQIAQETNVYSANLAFNATAGVAGGLVLEGLMMVPLPPVLERRDDPQMSNANTGAIPSDVCDADPNSPEFWVAQCAYAERIQNAAQLACEQIQRLPQVSPSGDDLLGPSCQPKPVPTLHPAEHVASSPSSPTSLIYPEPPSLSSTSSGSIIVEHIPDTNSGSPPIYATSIGIRTPSSSNSSTKTDESHMENIYSSGVQGCDNCDPPATVPFHADGQFNPYFQPLRITYTDARFSSGPIAPEPTPDSEATVVTDAGPSTAVSVGRRRPRRSVVEQAVVAAEQ
ncbi:hypothetical protein Moror_9631 [Moniliophthora roreri MCA 2997]|uniref:Uncharacterized protein n=1 Tax=Moniliophthora roreri (strain MCA 2997) TaxID=1381753 RepID=V2WJS8_MONRO|nr:hypothetical protein Moror_9631 [Moniliophthora roreri MCA 2997]